LGGLRTKAVPQQPKILAVSCTEIFVARVLPHCAHFHHWEIIIVVGTDPVLIYFNGRKNTMRNYRAGILILTCLLGRLPHKPL